MNFFGAILSAAVLVAHVGTSQSASQLTTPTGPCKDMLMSSMMNMHQAMEKVQTTGPFDSDFMKLMLPHHQAALDMAKAELLCGNNPAVRRLAQEIIADQSSEIELMHLLLKQQPPAPPVGASPRGRPIAPGTKR